LASFMTGVENIGHGVTDPLIAKTPIFGESLKRGAEEIALDTERSREKARAISPKSAKIGETLGEIAGFAPIGAAAAMLGGGGLGTAGLEGAAFGFARRPDEGESRIENALYGGAAGLATGGILKGAGATHKGLSGILTRATGSPTLGKSASLGILGGAGSYGGAKAYNALNPEEQPLDPKWAGIYGAAGLPLAAATPGLAKSAFKKSKGGLAKLTGFPKSAVAEEIMPTVSKDIARRTPEDLAYSQELASRGLKRQEAAERLGTSLTPAEATGSPSIAQQQGTLGRTPAGKQIMERSRAQQSKKQIGAVSNLMRETGPGGEGQRRARKVARDIFQDDISALKEKAAPLYDKAYQEFVAPDEIKPLLRKETFNEFRKKAFKRFPDELKGYEPNSVKVLDYTKKAIDDARESAIRKGDKNYSRYLTELNNQITTVADEASPAYKQARQVYSEELPFIKELSDSQLGSIAELPDDKLSQVSKILFNPNKTDKFNFERIRSRFIQKNPDAWDRITRNYIEDLVKVTGQEFAGQEAQDLISQPGKTFYNKVLKDNNKFKRLLESVSHKPEAQQMLRDMKRAWPDLIPNFKPGTAAAQAKSSLDVARSSAQAKWNAFLNFTGGHFDEVASELITTDEWVNQMRKVLNEPKGPQQQNLFTNLMLEIWDNTRALTQGEGQFVTPAAASVAVGNKKEQ